MYWFNGVLNIRGVASNGTGILSLRAPGPVRDRYNMVVHGANNTHGDV